MMPFDKIKNAPITSTDTAILSGKVVGQPVVNYFDYEQIPTITVETSKPLVVEDVKKFIQTRLNFKFYCKLSGCKPNLKSYVKYLKQKAL